ncbi:MAG: branched-chain amino acid ABC transporter permease [Candidatus Lokiarchaeota archaeon]|nr:branched-chain amino acid ABC transporter permease [Candidatus Lokiarchaeota archaeon]
MVDEILVNILNVLLFGSVQGAVFALLALGLSLVYGVGGILNLAHGAFYLIAMYMFYWCIKIWEFPLITTIIIALVVVVIIAAVSYLLLIKPLQESLIGVVIVTFSLAYFFEQLVKVLPWSDTRTHWVPAIFEGPVSVFGISFPVRYIFAVSGSLILVVLVTLFINKSKLGKSIRAVSQDREAAQLMGINANLVIMITVVLSAFLAGMGAIFYGAGDEVYPAMGWGFLTTSFAIVVLGGLGSIPGSILGAFIMAYARVFCSYFISTQFAEIFPIIVIIVMLVFRPQGLLGKKEVE